MARGRFHVESRRGRRLEGQRRAHGLGRAPPHPRGPTVRARLRECPRERLDRADPWSATARAALSPPRAKARAPGSARRTFGSGRHEQPRVWPSQVRPPSDSTATRTTDRAGYGLSARHGAALSARTICVPRPAGSRAARRRHETRLGCVESSGPAQGSVIDDGRQVPLRRAGSLRGRPGATTVGGGAVRGYDDGPALRRDRYRTMSRTSRRRPARASRVN